MRGALAARLPHVARYNALDCHTGGERLSYPLLAESRLAGVALFDAPVVKKRKVETAATSNITLTESERYKREDAGCAARLKKQEPELLPCRDPDEGEDDQGVGDRFQGYDGFTIGGPPVFR